MASNNKNNNNEDPFAVFGPDSDNDDGELTDGHKVANYLTQYCLSRGIQRADLHVDLQLKEDNWREELRPFRVCSSDLYDVCITDKENPTNMDKLVPNGILIVPVQAITSNDENRIEQIPGTDWVVRSKLSISVALETCPWHTARKTEQEMVPVVCLSVVEQMTGIMSKCSIQAAVKHVNEFGYCIIRHLLDPTLSIAYGQAVLKDLDLADTILKAELGIEIKQAGDKSITRYREISMREDFRMDLRDGPNLRKLRGIAGNQPARYTASQTSSEDFLRGNCNILSIVRQVMNPVNEELSVGNYGRYNFDGSGPDGSFQDLVAGIVGGVVSLPGAADQAIHADTPHLFEHLRDPLPAHYINVFTPGCPATDYVGQTAFIHGSHRLDFVARHTDADGNLDQSLWDFLVRPKLDLGDVLLFDCRILHFGLSNTHSTIERPLLYTNMTIHWFHDPKNWDQHRAIFSDEKLDMHEF